MRRLNRECEPARRVQMTGIEQPLCLVVHLRDFCSCFEKELAAMLTTGGSGFHQRCSTGRINLRGPSKQRHSSFCSSCRLAQISAEDQELLQDFQTWHQEGGHRTVTRARDGIVTAHSSPRKQSWPRPAHCNPCWPFDASDMRSLQHFKTLPRARLRQLGKCG